MLFSSMIFLWLFLPAVFVIDKCLKPKGKNAFLLLASLFFYAWGEPKYVLLMLCSIFLNWSCGLLLCRYPRFRRVTLWTAVSLNLALLGYFKYMGLIVRSLNHLLRREVFALPGIALPIGISFFTFQALSYVIDVYRGECRAQRNILYLALYISFFPQLIAGPIVKYRDISEQIESRAVTARKLAEGIRRFIYGLAKKVLLANVLAQSADRLFALQIDEMTGVMAWTASLLYTFQIYYDFSGYSDMAIGLGKLFGFDFRENFRYPYLSCSIREFWRRWHISLGAWFREYVYIPLGGSRGGNLRTCRNLGLVFLLTGLWHGAGYNFILWGLYHGFFLIVERIGLGRFLERHKRAAFVYTFLTVHLGWILFRIESVRLIWAFGKRIVLPWRYTASHYSVWEFVNGHTLFALLCAAAGMGIVQRLIAKTGRGGEETVQNGGGKLQNGEAAAQNSSEGLESGAAAAQNAGGEPESGGRAAGLAGLKLSMPELAYCMALLLLCIAALANNTYNPFIYFRF